MLMTVSVSSHRLAESIFFSSPPRTLIHAYFSNGTRKRLIRMPKLSPGSARHFRCDHLMIFTVNEASNQAMQQTASERLKEELLRMKWKQAPPSPVVFLDLPWRAVADL